jgi:hypothetical protein
MLSNAHRRKLNAPATQLNSESQKSHQQTADEIKKQKKRRVEAEMTIRRRGEEKSDQSFGHSVTERSMS